MFTVQNKTQQTSIKIGSKTGKFYIVTKNEYILKFSDYK